VKRSILVFVIVRMEQWWVKDSSVVIHNGNIEYA
jgi:hypothetical protein